MGSDLGTALARPSRVRRGVALLALLMGAALAANGTASALTPAASGAIHVIPIDGEIDLGLAPFLARALDDAAEAEAAAVVLDIDTPGGRLDAVLQMRDVLLGARVPTIAFVDRTAFSAGALIALAAEEIHFAPGGVMGAATPVDLTGIPAEEKVISAVRSTFRSTAEARGRDPVVAEAMVDPDVVVDMLVGRGELLTLTASEAERVGYADGVAGDVDGLLVALGLDGREVVEAAIAPAERLVRLITNPIIASLLIAAGILLLVGDLLSGGVGVAAGVGAASLGLFFWGHLLAGLSGWEDVALVVLGVGLILVEVFVVPGFGVPGVLGLGALIGGSFLAMVGRDFDVVGTEQLVRAAATVGIAFVLIVIGLFAVIGYLSRAGGPGGRGRGARIGSGTPVTDRGRGGWLGWLGTGGVLARDDDSPPEALATLPDGHGAVRDADVPTTTPPPTAPHQHEHGHGYRHEHGHGRLTGTRGVALSDLRPAGVADLDGSRVDVVTEGEYIAAGEVIEVLHDEGYRRVVRRPRDA